MKGGDILDFSKGGKEGVDLEKGGGGGMTPLTNYVNSLLYGSVFRTQPEI